MGERSRASERYTKQKTAAEPHDQTLTLRLMRHVATLKYDERLVRRAVLSFWLRSMAWKTPVAVVIVAALFIARLAMGDRSWVVGLLGGVAILGILMPVAVYWTHYRNSMAKFRELGNPVATLLAEETSFTLSSDAGASILKWNAVTELWCFEGLWLFLFSKAHFATIPLDAMSAEMQSYVVDRVRTAGGKVVG